MSHLLLILLHILIYGGLFAVYAPPWFGLIMAGFLIWASLIDIDRFEIPDLASLGLCLTGVGAAYGLQNFTIHLIAGVFWGSLFWLIAFGYRKLRGWDGLGMGDVKLITGIAIWVGLYETIWVVLAAAVAGILVIFMTVLIKGGSFQGQTQSGVAFGPFLCLSAWAIWLNGVA